MTMRLRYGLEIYGKGAKVKQLGKRQGLDVDAEGRGQGNIFQSRRKLELYENSTKVRPWRAKART